MRTSKMELERTLKLRGQTFDLLREFLALEGVSALDIPLFAHPRIIGETWTKYRKLTYKKFRDPNYSKSDYTTYAISTEPQNTSKPDVYSTLNT